jgi:filamentous hemagglutinin family protein
VWIACLLALELLLPPAVLANPRGAVVHRGRAVVTGEGTGRVDVHQASRKAVLSWQSFDVEAGEVTEFHQPDSSSVALNRIVDVDGSRIFGSLRANGHVYLINPHGILFAPGSQVNVHALLASTSVDATGLAAGGFDPSAQASPGARIENHGAIETGRGGFVYLVAPHVENGRDGVIVSPEGEIRIEAGATVYLADRPDGLGLAVEYTAPAGGEAVNLGRLVAEGGLARLRADLVTQGGVVEASSVRERDGVIELVADSELELASGSVTAARGGAEAGSSGGTVWAWSDGAARMHDGARIDVSASARGADGGFAELSAGRRVEVAGRFEAGAGAGGRAGEVLIDPAELVVTNETSFAGAGRVLLTADERVSVAEGTALSLAAGAGSDAEARQTLTLRSGGDVVFERGARIEDDGTGLGGAKTWDVEVVAGADLGRDPTAPGATTDDVLALDRTTSGDVVLEGAGFEGPAGISLARGDLTVLATGDVVLGDGAALRSREGDVRVGVRGGPGGELVFEPVGGDVRFEAGRTSGPDTVIESGSGDVSVVAEGSVLLQDGFGGGGHAAIRTRGVAGTDSFGRETRQDGGSILVWAKQGDVDAGIANRWVEPGPGFSPAFYEKLRQEFDLPPLPPGEFFDVLPVVRASETEPFFGNFGADGILGIGAEAGGDVVVLAGGDVRTRQGPGIRSGGTASGLGTTYDGSHIGVFGVPVAFQDAVLPGFPPFDYAGPVPLAPASNTNRLVVVAGGSITGDYMVRDGEAWLLAGYALAPGSDPLALGLGDPAGVDRAALRQGLAVSELARTQASRAGWVGTVADPITVDLVAGSLDALGRNGVAVRAVENPSLVYPPAQTLPGTFRAPSFSPSDEALLEAETGDVLLVGNDVRLPEPANPQAVENPLVRLLPPSVVVRTHPAGSESGDVGRAGDLVLLNDFAMFPSAEGGLELDVAGRVRTANSIAAGPATMDVIGTSSGTAADLSFQIPGGTSLLDPETGLVYTLGSSGLSFAPRDPAQPAEVSALFRAAPGFAGSEVVIPAGTRVVDYAGNVYETQGESILPPELRRSRGEVLFVPEGGTVTESVTIPALTRLETAGGLVFETQQSLTLRPGDTATSVPVLALPSQAGSDAGARTLRLAAPIAGIAEATNHVATARPAEAQIRFVALETGAAQSGELGRVRSLVGAVPGAELVFSEQPKASGGRDLPATGGLLFPTNARATVSGPSGEIREPRSLVILTAENLPSGVSPEEVQLFDPASLPPGVSLADLEVFATGVAAGGQAPLTAALFEEPQGAERRIDRPDDRIPRAEDLPALWLRESADPVATLRQSDADPGYDGRNGSLAFDYAGYYRLCHSGTTCTGIVDPIESFGPEQVFVTAGSGPTHALDTTPASLRAQGGFSRVRLELAEAADLLAGSEPDGSAAPAPADLFDFALATQHSRPDEVTTLWAPHGDAWFGSDEPEERRRVLDENSGLETTIVGDSLSGVTVSGPGSVRVLVGVVPGGDPEGEPWAPSGTGGALALSNVAVGSGSARGIETVGNVVNAALPEGGASLEIVVAADVVLNDRGAIDTLQGGDVSITSLEGGLVGGEPEPEFEFKRGIFTLYAPSGGGDALESGGGDVVIRVAGDFDIGRSALATLSGGDITIESGGSVSAGIASPFRLIGVSTSQTTSLPEVQYQGGGIFASTGKVTLVAEEDVDIGAGITGAAISIAAGGNVVAGQGAIAASGDVSISAGGEIGGTIVAGGSISIGGGEVSSGASIAAGGLVVGASSASNTGAGKVNAETVATARQGSELGSTRTGTGTSRRRVIVEVTSQPSGEDEKEGES